MKKYGLAAIAVAIIAILLLAYVFYPRGLQLYFFFQDSDFSLVHDSKLDKWESFGWNKSDPFDYKVSFGNDSATLFYNESSGREWGGTVLLQGRQPHSGESVPGILGGTSFQDSKEVDYVEFNRSNPIKNGMFFLEARVMVTARNYTVFDANGEAVSNVGADLMFGFDDANYDDPNNMTKAAIHAGIIFSRASWDNETKTIYHAPNWSNLTTDLYGKDFQITFIRWQIPELNTFYTPRIDLAEIIAKIFELTHTETIRFYGVQVYVDGIGSYTQATFNYVRTSLNS